MKKFTEAKFELIKFEENDIIATSSCPEFIPTPEQGETPIKSSLTTPKRSLRKL